MPPRLANKVLLVGWDAADWKVATPLIDRGLMPHLNAMINAGVMGNLATLEPVLSPLLWNSIATGKRPDKHGIHGFMEPDPQTGGVRPVSSISRKVKAIWNILTQRGFKTHVLGWFAGHPAEPINGISVSDMYPYAVAPLDRPWPMPPGTVHPLSLHDTLAELRMHPAEVTKAAILPWIPDAPKIDQKTDKHLVSFAKILSENLSIHNAATWILETQPWDFMAVYYNGLDHFSHGFMPFHPPRMDGIPEEQFEIYKDVVNNAYRFHDMLLRRLLELAGPDVTVMLVSDHGFHSDHLRPRIIPNEPTGPAVQHREFGIICLQGEHIKKDERIYGATLLDVTPTILTLFGLPVGEDMDGRVLVTAFEDPPRVERIPSWESEPGECGMHAADLRMAPDAAKAVLEQFVALGYIQPLTENQANAVASAVRECNYNLARVYLGSGRPHLALPLFEALVKEAPEELRFLQHLAHCYYQLNRNNDAQQILETLIRHPPVPRQPDKTRHANEEISSEAAMGGTPAEAPPQHGQHPAWADWLMGLMQFEEGNFETALDYLLRAEQINPRLPTLHSRIGNTYLRMGKIQDAERAFQRALEIDGDNPEAHLGVALVRLRQRRHEEASEEALHAVSLQHFLPLGHFVLGISLARLGHFDRAALAFETSLAMAPGLVAAHRWLAAIYARPGGDRAIADRHRLAYSNISKQRQANAAERAASITTPISKASGALRAT